MTGRIRVLVADDHPMVREGVRHVLADVEDFEVLRDVEDVAATLDALGGLRPDVALLDLSMPETEGVEIVERAIRASPRTRLVVLSMHGDADTVSGALSAGAISYLLKDEAGPAELRDAVRAAAVGEAFFTPSVAAILAGALRRGTAPTSAVSALDGLTEREREVLQGIAEGLSNKQLAARLGIGRRTVESHRENLMQKLGIRNVAGLTRFAIEAGVVPIDLP